MTRETSEPTGARPVAAEMDVSDQVAFLNSILEISTEYSIVAKDLEGTILAWNEGARRIYGYEPMDVIGDGAAPAEGATAAGGEG